MARPAPLESRRPPPRAATRALLLTPFPSTPTHIAALAPLLPLAPAAAVPTAAAARAKSTRTERDTFGPLEVPADK